MTSKIFFDTDGLSAFLWAKEECLLTKLFPKIIVPKEVYIEMSKPGVEWMKKNIDLLVRKGQVEIEDIEYNTEEFKLYSELALNIEPNKKLIGRGEAAAISLACKYQGILASNNLSDISIYIEKYNLEHLTTGDILIMAYENSLITEDEGNIIWGKMLKKRRKIGANTFSEYMCIKRN